MKLLPDTRSGACNDALFRELRELEAAHPALTRQIKYEWDYLYGSLDAVSGQAHFAHLPGVNLEWAAATSKTSPRAIQKRSMSSCATKAVFTCATGMSGYRNECESWTSHPTVPFSIDLSRRKSA